MGAASSQRLCAPQRLGAPQWLPSSSVLPSGSALPSGSVPPQPPRAGPAGPGHLRAGGGLGKGDSEEEDGVKASLMCLSPRGEVVEESVATLEGPVMRKAEKWTHEESTLASRVVLCGQVCGLIRSIFPRELCRMCRSLRDTSEYFVELYMLQGSVTQSHPTFCDPIDCSPPGSSVHGISPARILEWVAICYSRGYS